MHNTLPITNSAIMITMFPEIGVVNIGINLNFEDATTDQVIFLKQCHGNAEKFEISNNNKVNKMSISELFHTISMNMGISTNASNQNYLVEINKFSEYNDLKTLLSKEAKRIYGFMTGDEGCQYIDDALAFKRISQNWGSRSFFRLIAFNSNYILINLNESNIVKKYEEHQTTYSTTYYGNINDYFSLKSSFAGVNHGILFSLETVMAIKTVTKYILDKHANFQNTKIKNFHEAIKRTNSYRKDLILTLNKLEQIGIAELGELENLVLRSQQIDPIIEKIKYLLELLESDLTLMYSERTNKLINWLTIFGLIFTAIQTIIAVIDIF